MIISTNDIIMELTDLSHLHSGSSSLTLEDLPHLGSESSGLKLEDLPPEILYMIVQRVDPKMQTVLLFVKFFAPFVTPRIIWPTDAIRQFPLPFGESAHDNDAYDLLRWA